MYLTDITAANLVTGDCVLIAGNLYTIGVINTYINGTVGIQFYTTGEFEQLTPSRMGNMTVASTLPMEVLRTI